ncbi:MAG: Flp family type IVb pilin [Planctomycetota bacterium]|jgi:Flp pilus assembly pilin Flp
MLTTVKRFLADDQGLETVEYAIILGLIVVAVIGAVAGIGSWVNTRFQDLNSELANNP